MSIKTVTYILPTYLACALVNSDETNLDGKEQDNLNNWVSEKSQAHGGLFHCVDVEDYGFCHFNDYDNLGSNCSKYTFHVNEE